MIESRRGDRLIVNALTKVFFSMLVFMGLRYMSLKHMWLGLKGLTEPI